MSVDKMIEENTGLIYKQLHRFNLQDNQDAESLCYEALWNAALTYDASKGFAFSTYATVCIYNMLCRFVHPKRRKVDIVYAQEDTSYAALLDMLAATSSAEDEYGELERLTDLLNAIQRAYNKLNNVKYKKIIRAWQDSDYTLKQSDLARTLNISQATVSMAINIFRFCLKQELEEQK